MTSKIQALILAVLIFLSVAITNLGNDKTAGVPSKKIGEAAKSAAPELSFERASLLSASANLSQYDVKRVPERNWDVLDPKISSEAVLVQSLDNDFPFFNLNTYKVWPIASLTKLITAVITVEDIGEDKKIAVDEAAVQTEGEAGGLKSGEVYTARDLLKIMLLTSSNDAAAAFESYLGKAEFVRLMNEKIQKLGMTQTRIYDASGLNDENVSTATDILKLVKYILEKEPQIFNWTRITSQLVQPLNDVTGRAVLNINSLATESGFLGGKTGTSEKARQNEAAIFSQNGQRLVVIVLGSSDRDKEIKNVLNWVKGAYPSPLEDRKLYQ